MPFDKNNLLEFFAKIPILTSSTNMLQQNKVKLLQKLELSLDVTVRLS